MGVLNDAKYRSVTTGTAPIGTLVTKLRDL